MGHHKTSDARAPRALLAAAIATALSLLAVFLLPPAAGAAAPEALWQAPPDGLPGEEAGRLANPRGMASDPVSGEVYVADRDNERISVFDGEGNFARAWGWGVADDPGAGPQAEEPQSCTAPAGCFKGLAGSGAGQLDNPQGIAVDAARDVYVFDRAAHRVEKFDFEGNFILMFGGEVDKTTGEDVCTAASDEECGVGVPGPGPGEFETGMIGNYIAVDSEDHVYVGDKERVQIFNPDGTHKEDLPDPEGRLSGETVQSLAVGPEGDVYLVLSPQVEISGSERVLRLDPAGEAVGAEPLKAKAPKALATSEGDVYVLVACSGEKGKEHESEEIKKYFDVDEEVIGYDAGGTPIEGMEVGQRFAHAPAHPFQGDPKIVHNGLASCAAVPEGVYASSFRIGVAAQLHHLLRPPTLRRRAAAPRSEAAVRRLGGDRRGGRAGGDQPPPGERCLLRAVAGVASPGSEWEEGYLEPPLAPGALLTGEEVNKPVPTAGVLLGGLNPASTYYFRFVAQSSLGGPVYGEGEGECALDPHCGEGAAFTTFPALGAAKSDCPNQALRIGPSAPLPDCRAFEMVSPVDKNGGEIKSFGAVLEQSAVGGGGFAYAAEPAFADPQGAPINSRYLAWRGAGGWSNQSLSPPRGVQSICGRLPRASSRGNSKPSRPTSARAGSCTSPTRRSPPGRRKATSTSTGARTAHPMRAAMKRPARSCSKC